MTVLMRKENHYLNVQAPKILSTTNYFFCNYVGNLTAIYDVGFFWENPISPIRKRQGLDAVAHYSTAD
jgi:hypothetical protein